MIRVDLQTAAGIYFIGVVLFFVLMPLVFGRRKRRKEWNITDYAQRCIYCGHVFINHKPYQSVRCPLCHSYLEDVNAHQKT